LTISLRFPIIRGLFKERRCFPESAKTSLCVRSRPPRHARPGRFITCYPGFHALLVHRHSRTALWRMKLRLAGALRLALLAVSHRDYEIHPGREDRPACVHRPWHGRGRAARRPSSATNWHALSRVTLGGTTWNKGKRHPTLGKGVVIGAGAKCSARSRSVDGHGSARNAVVVKDVQPGSDRRWGIPRAASSWTSRTKSAREKAGQARVLRVPRSPPRRRTIPSPRRCRACLDHSLDMDKRIELILQGNRESLKAEQDMRLVRQPRGWRPQGRRAISVLILSG